MLRLAVDGSAQVVSCRVFHIHLRERDNYLDSGIIGDSLGSVRNKNALDLVRRSCDLTNHALIQPKCSINKTLTFFFKKFFKALVR